MICLGRNGTKNIKALGILKAHEFEKITNELLSKGKLSYVD